MRLIHIGYPKCASSLLQDAVFPKLPVPFHCKANNPAFYLAIFSEHFRAEDVRETIPEETALISLESLVGNPLTPGWGEEIASRLHRCFPDAHIAVITRNPLDLIESLALEYISGKHRCTVDEMVARFDLAWFRHETLIALYETLFPGRVHVHRYADFGPAMIDRMLAPLGLSADAPLPVSRPRPSPWGYALLQRTERRTPLVHRCVQLLNRAYYATGGKRVSLLSPETRQRIGSAIPLPP